MESRRSVAGGEAHRAERVYYRFIVPPVELTFSRRLRAVLIPLSWWLFAPAARAYAVLLMSVKLTEMGNQTLGELNPPFSSHPVGVNGIKPQIDSCYSCLDTCSVYSVSILFLFIIIYLLFLLSHYSHPPPNHHCICPKWIGSRFVVSVIALKS